jgi:hypothetical protein
MGVTWGSVVESNKNMYIAEELPLLTVMPTQNRIYFREGVTELIAVIPPAIYDGPTLATRVAEALTTAGSTVYTAAYTASATTPREHCHHTAGHDCFQGDALRVGGPKTHEDASV